MNPETQNMLDLANQGDSDAMYNLGVIYLKGINEKKNTPLAITWFEKAAAYGDTDAKKLIDSMQSDDILARAVISKENLDAYMSFQMGKSEYREAIAGYKRVLEKSEDIWTPTEKDLFTRREIYRNLGMITYLLKEGEQYLQEAELYYENGIPIEETQDLRSAACYVMLMDSLYQHTGNNAYAQKCYDVSENIYRTRFEEIDDNDFKGLFLKYIIIAKTKGVVCPLDLDGAAQLNEIFGSYGSEFANEYEENRQNISKARQTNKNSTAAAATTSSSKKKGLWGWLTGR